MKQISRECQGNAEDILKKYTGTTKDIQTQDMKKRWELSLNEVDSKHKRNTQTNKGNTKEFKGSPRLEDYPLQASLASYDIGGYRNIGLLARKVVT